MNYDRPELRDRLAAEYVLGTMVGAARRRFKRLIKADVKTRVAVEIWEERLMPMGGPVEVPAPSPKVWEGIAARVAPRQSAAQQPSWFERWFGTRALGGLAAGLMMGIGVMLIVPELQRSPPNEQQLPQSYVGILHDTEGRATMLVSSLRHGSVVDIKVVQPVTVQGDRVLQLWALTRDGAPQPLGLVPASGKGHVTINGTSEQLLSKVTELAVSVEPKATAPMQAPSGAFVLRGPCAKFW